MATIYTGSVHAAHGRPVLWQDPCRCDESEFRCPQCAGFTEYAWMQCPHEAPTARLSLAVAGDDGAVLYLVHARRTSIHDRAQE